MATQVQNRRGTTAEHSTFTGANGELTVDTTKRTLVVHDGATAGGRPLLREDQSNLPTSAPTTGIYNASGSLAISTNSVGRLFVDASGRVGINTSTPERSLGVWSATNDDGIQIRNTSSAASVNKNSRLQFVGTDTSGTAKGTANIYCLAADQDLVGAHLSFWTRGSDVNAERLRITSAGLVGVGTSSPSANLHVNSAGNTETLIGASSGSSVLTMTANVGAGGGSNIGFQGPLIFSSVTGAALAGATERARIDSSGRLLVGTSTSTTGVAFPSQIQSNAFYAYSASLFSADNTGSHTWFLKSRNATVNQHTAVQSGDVLGRINFAGSDGDEFIHAALIQAVVDNGAVGTAVSNNECPAALVFSTTADGASSPTERMRIDNKGFTKLSNTGSYVALDCHQLRSDANTINTFINSTNATYTSNVLQVRTTKSGNSDFQLAVFASNDGGDIEFNLRGDGNAFADGSWSGGGADYAEFFEWADSNPDAEDRRGISVVLDGYKIREAQAGEDPIGVISGNPSVVGDAAWNKWSGKYLRDEFGTYIQEDYEVADDNGNTVIQQRRKLNPAYDPDMEYISREQRPEWDCVGLMGKLRIRKGQVTGSRWIKMRDISDSVEEWLVR